MVYLLAMLLFFGACQEEDWGGQSMGGNWLTLDLQTSAVSTRAPIVGEDRFNENVVTSVDVYFFADGQETTAGYLYAQTGLVPEGSTLQVELDKSVILDNSTYYIYVVANRTDNNFTDASGNTLAALKQRTITTNWKEGYTENESVTEESLVMDGSTTVTVKAEGTEGHVVLTRAMAKVMLYAAAEKSIEMDNVTYIPTLDRMNVTMVYGVKRTNLEGTYAVTSSDNVESSDYITRMRRDYTSNTITETITDGEDAEEIQYYEQEAPFYSYPNPESTAERQDAYLILCVPWEERYEGGSYRSHNYYYRIPITGSTAPATLERNHYYRIKVNIGVLGSLNPNEAVEITDADFEILDWFDMEVDADMQKYEYLVLDEYNSVMNNVNSIENAYISSSALKMSPDNQWDTEYTRVVSVSYTDYQKIDIPNATTSVRDLNDYFVELGNDNTLIFRHTLPDDAYVCYTITIEVWNMDDIKQTWVIEQYPPIYIEGERAEGRLFVAGNYTTTYDMRDQDQSYDNVYYNNYYLGSVQNPESVDGSAGNRNYNNYTIYISSFKEGDGDYVIGDPRKEKDEDTQQDPNNLNMTDIQEYRPTRTGTKAMRIIAPAFKIASSRGKTLPVTFQNAQRRCAAYQEDGYPAGRWRIPTEAEIEFIVGLSGRGKIPSLFDGTYWSASGRTYTSNTSGGYFSPNNIDEDYIPDNSSTNAVRCVYDVWYWGEEDITNTGDWTKDNFVWGDATDGTLTHQQETNLN